MEYTYNDDTNTVTAIMRSNEILKDTKPTWNLSEDRLSYSKEYGANMKYLTPVQDIWGNETIVELDIIRSR